MSVADDHPLGGLLRRRPAAAGGRAASLCGMRRGRGAGGIAGLAASAVGVGRRICGCGVRRAGHAHVAAGGERERSGSEGGSEGKSTVDHRDSLLQRGLESGGAAAAALVRADDRAPSCRPKALPCADVVESGHAGAARTSSSSSPTTSASPTSAATAAGCRCRRCSTGWPRNGLRFTQGYANSPVCSPTRFALMTGALPVPAARRGRGADQQQEPRQHHARPAAGASDPAVAAARRRLPHRARSASGTSAIRRPSGRCARATTSSSARCRAASTTSPTAIRAARTTSGSARQSIARRATSPT